MWRTEKPNSLTEYVTLHCDYYFGLDLYFLSCCWCLMWWWHSQLWWPFDGIVIFHEPRIRNMIRKRKTWGFFLPSVCFWNVLSFAQASWAWVSYTPWRHELMLLQFSPSLFLYPNISLCMLFHHVYRIQSLQSKYFSILEQWFRRRAQLWPSPLAFVSVVGQNRRLEPVHFGDMHS